MISFVWWHGLIALFIAAWFSRSVWVWIRAGWKMALLWPIYMLFALFGWVNVQ